MATSIRWQVPGPWSPEEARIARDLHRIAKFYVFLRETRDALFDEAGDAS